MPVARSSIVRNSRSTPRPVTALVVTTRGAGAASVEALAQVVEVDLLDVPLRDDHDRRAARLARLVGDVQVLLGEALRRVDQHERDVGVLAPRAARAPPTSTRPAGAACACGAGRPCRSGGSRAVALEPRVDRVARRARACRRRSRAACRGAR